MQWFKEHVESDAQDKSKAGVNNVSKPAEESDSSEDSTSSSDAETPATPGEEDTAAAIPNGKPAQKRTSTAATANGVKVVVH